MQNIKGTAAYVLDGWRTILQLWVMEEQGCYLFNTSFSEQHEWEYILSMPRLAKTSNLPHAHECHTQLAASLEEERAATWLIEVRIVRQLWSCQVSYIQLAVRKGWQ